MTKLPCPPDLWPAFSALLDEAMDVPDRERPAWLAALGSEHAAVRPWLARVITTAAAAPEPHFLQTPAGESADPELRAGARIGPYLLQERLGSGGMGEVWLAARSDGSLNRQIALKLPHVHLMAGVLRRRFERERDILAGLSHPHIAQLYDAGVADSQHPYLAMEWVDGIAINEHCRRNKLPIEARLDLILQVLDAVGHAHAKLIAHRDLKPSNIMVTRDAQVKLLDFGIAKLLVEDTGGGATQLTRVGTCLATPAYAAPEQLAGRPITAAVDLYALGVILHELLTGQRPHREKPNGSSGPGDAARASTRIDSAHAPFVGGLEPRQLRRALSGDLDAIIAKALEADPARRYRSAEAFAQDIDASRQHRPISALRVTPATVALKFMRRHWIGAAMTAGLALALIGGSAGIAWQAVRAQREAQRATTIKDFLIGVFRASDPRIAADKPRGEITARELLDVSTQQIESGFAQQPETQIELLGVTADIYRELDETQRSSALYAREADLAARYEGAADSHAIDGLLGQAYNARLNGDHAHCLEMLAQADPLLRRGRLDHTALRARWLLIRGEALMDDPGRGDDAQTALEAAVAIFKTVSPGDPRYADALSDLGNLTLERFQFAQSAAYYRQAIAVSSAGPPLQGSLLWPTAGLALALEHLGDFDGAAAAFERGADIAEHTYGRDSHNYWAIASDWAQFRYEQRGEREAALAAFETLVKELPDRTRFRNATDARETALVLRKYGHCLATDGQGARSLQLLEQAQALQKQSGARAGNAGYLQLDFAKAYEALGRIPEAQAAFLSALDALLVQGVPALREITHERWGRFLLSQNDPSDAYREFEEVLRLSDGHPRASAIFARAGIAAIAASGGDVRAAVENSGRAMDQLDHIEGGFDIRIRPYVWGVRAEALLMAGDSDSAVQLAQRARSAALRFYAPESAAVEQAQRIVAAASHGAQQP